jgi:hypothetical protein
MSSSIKKSLIIFAVGSILLACVFFLFPINLFDGVIIEQRGIQTITHERPLSLSYFIGLGYLESDMIGIKDFYLKPKGMLMAFLFIFGFPSILAYRSYLKD